MSCNGSCEISNETMANTNQKSKIDATSDCCQHATETGGPDSRFSCNICFDEVQEPVVTRCGHLYCWPCLFQWLEPGMNREERESLGLSSFRYGGSDPSRRLCPVSKLECPLHSLVPLYVRSASSASSKQRTSEIESNKTDPRDAENNTDQSSHEDGFGSANEGLRRRRTDQTSNDSNNNTDSSNTIPVPNRPSVTHPQHVQEEPSSPPISRRGSPGSRASTDNPYRVGGVQLTPRSPNGHNGSLTHGILSSLQRVTAEYYRNNSNNNTIELARRRIPSLHDRQNPMSNHNADGSGRFRDSSQEYPLYDEGNGNLNSETTQYLTRLLIMLTSFVIFCFLAV